MRYGFAKRALRRRIRNASTWSILRRLLVTYQYFARQPDEPEIRLFRVLDTISEDLLFADIGANGGQTAVGIARVLPGARIESFEPNPALTPELAWVKRLLGQRFNHHTFGLGAQPGTMTLHVPHVDDLPVTTRASLSERVAQDRVGELNRETSRTAEARPLQVEIKRFDDLDLRPHGIKIDVEGVELEVLRGMAETLGACRPLLMLEYNNQTGECRSLLATFGYDFWDVEPATGSLVPAGRPSIRNWFAIPPAPKLRTSLGLAT